MDLLLELLLVLLLLLLLYAVCIASCTQRVALCATHYDYAMNTYCHSRSRSTSTSSSCSSSSSSSSSSRSMDPWIHIFYQYRPPEAGDRVLGCIRPAG